MLVGASLLLVMRDQFAQGGSRGNEENNSKADGACDDLRSDWKRVCSKVGRQGPTAEGSCQSGYAGQGTYSATTEQ